MNIIGMVNRHDGYETKFDERGMNRPGGKERQIKKWWLRGKKKLR